jgi:hypothetical protein
VCKSRPGKPSGITDRDKHVDSILKHGLDRLPEPMAPPPLPLMPAHAQIRGREYYRDPDAPEAPAPAAAGEHAR